MKKGFFPKRPVFPQLWSHHQGPSLQQRRLTKSEAELASSTELRTLLDEIENLNSEENKNQYEETELSEGLSLSPLMDPALRSARERHTRPKRSSKRENLSDLEKKLLMNPYARAIASPIRYCGLTDARLPKEFLLNFGVQEHPNTGSPWHFPVLAEFRLPEPRSNSTTQDPPLPPAQTSASENSIPESATGIARPEPLSGPHKKTSSPSLRTVSISSRQYERGNYYLCSYGAMKILSTNNDKLVFKTLPLRWRVDGKTAVSKFIWRQDMYIFIQKLLRKQAFEELKSSATGFTSLVVEDSPNMPLDFMSAALWLGKSKPLVPEDATPDNHKVVLDEDENGMHLEQRHISGSVENKQSVEPPFYAMMSHPAGVYMPLYNLPVLIGAQLMQELRKVARVFGGETVYLPQGEKTVKVQLALWKLMGYMSLIGEADGKLVGVTGPGDGGRARRNKKLKGRRQKAEEA